MVHIDDFIPKDLVKIQDHKDLSNRVDKIEKKLGDGFVEFFCRAAGDSTRIQAIIASKITELLQSDVKTKEAVKKVVDETDGHYMKGILKKGGNLVFLAVTFILGSVGTIIIQHLMRRLSVP